MSLNFLRLGGLTLALAASACTANVSGPEADGTGGSGMQPPGGGSGAGTGAVGTGGGPVVDPGNGKIKLEGKPFYSRAVRLTNDQWTNSVKNALALSSPPTQAEGFAAAVKGTTDFMNNEQVLSVDQRAWSDYQSAAEALVKQVTSDAASLSKLYSGTDAAGFISTVGRRFYRRPLTAAEVTSYQTLFDTGSKSSGTLSAFAKGAGYVLEAMLQSPNFLYRTELGAAGMPLTGFEVAAKVSLWLRDSGPDDALLDEAAKGALDTPDGLAAATQKLVEDPAAKAVMRKFHKEFLHFDKFDQLSKEAGEAPDYDPAINPELLEASYLFFEKIFTQNLGVKDIFTSTKGFVGPKMATVLGMNGAASGLAEQELGPQRAGFFQQLPFLMLYAHNDESDPIHRGVSMSLDVLCAPLPFFAGTIPPLPARQKGQTNRTRVDAHTSGCGTACHNNMINPLGFAFEHFDGMGRYRDMEVHPDETLPIDASGSFEFVGGRKSYKDSGELMQTLVEDKQAHLCYSKKLAGYALQRDIVETDGALLASMADASQSANGSVKQILVSLVKQPAFRTRPGGVQ